jgi:enoyl-[acyl-carrier protein] reductase II
MTPDLLTKVIEATRAKTKKPFGVNLITMHPQIDELIDATLAQNVKFVVLAGGIPSGDSIKKIKEGGAKVICFAPALILAKKLIRSGVDALVVEGSEAGGHIGPVSTSVLAQEILPHITDIPVFVAGGIGRGEVMASYLRMGASGAQLGTMFVCAEESIAHENFKKMFMRGNARDAVTSVQIDKRFPVIPVRALKNAASIEFMDVQREVINKYQSGNIEMDAAQLEIEHYWAGALKKAVIDGDVENGSVMAGQSVGMVKKIEPVSVILENLVQQAADQLA